MNNKTRIIIGIIIVVLFLIGIGSLEHAQHINRLESTKFTNQNNTQIQINGTDKVDMESIDIVKSSLKDKSPNINIKSISVNVNKSSKVNTKLKNKSDEVQINTVKEDILQPSFTKSWFSIASLVERDNVEYIELKGSEDVPQINMEKQNHLL